MLNWIQEKQKTFNSLNAEQITHKSALVYGNSKNLS